MIFGLVLGVALVAILFSGLVLLFLVDRLSDRIWERKLTKFDRRLAKLFRIDIK